MYLHTNVQALLGLELRSILPPHTEVEKILTVCKVVAARSSLIPVCHSVLGGSVWQAPPGETPPWADTPPWEDTPPWIDTPVGRHPSPLQTATAVDDMHPTGMHSCLICLFYNSQTFVTVNT